MGSVATAIAHQRSQGTDYSAGYRACCGTAMTCLMPGKEAALVPVSHFISFMLVRKTNETAG